MKHWLTEASLFLSSSEGGHISGSILPVECLCVVVGLPSAMAAKLVKPDKVVLAVIGDGGFLMNSQVNPVVLLRYSYRMHSPFHGRDAACHVIAQMWISWPLLATASLTVTVSVKELATAVSMKMDLTVLILNDNAYGMIKWKQVTSSACASY